MKVGEPAHSHSTKSPGFDSMGECTHFVWTGFDKQDEEAVEERQSELNVSSDIVYDDPKCQYHILFGILHNTSFERHETLLLYATRFAHGQLYRFASNHRIVVSRLKQLAVTHRIGKGMSEKQATSARNYAVSSMPLHKFVFDRSASLYMPESRAVEEFFAAADWNLEMNHELFCISTRPDFVSAVKGLTAEVLDENFLMPRPLRVDDFPVVRNAMCSYAAIRVYTDHVAPQTAVDLVLKSNGYDGRTFFG